jgi:hypothetical protein
VQALIATTTVVVGEATARRGEIDVGVVGELTPALENAHHGGEPLGAPLGGAHHGGEPH